MIVERSLFLRSTVLSSTLLPNAALSADTMAKSTSTSLWRPGNLLAAIGVLMMRGLARLPISWLQGMGSVLGTLMAHLIPYRWGVGMTNLRLCFPDMPEAERKRLLRNHYRSLAMGFFEMAAAWYKSNEELAAISEIVGLEHLDAATQSGRGAIVFTGHFTTLEIIGRIFLLHRYISCHYRKINQPVLNRAMITRRGMGMKRMVDIYQVRHFIKFLREGDIFWYTPDQGRNIKYSEVVPFFGVPAVTNAATGRIAKSGNAAVVPFVGYRLPNGRYRIEIQPELEGFTDLDTVEEAALLNRKFEEMVLKAPDQYFWLHKRFKRRGPGYPDVYARQEATK